MLGRIYGYDCRSSHSVSRCRANVLDWPGTARRFANAEQLGLDIVRSDVVARRACGSTFSTLTAINAAPWDCRACCGWSGVARMSVKRSPHHTLS
jgi:hypothetical protein